MDNQLLKNVLREIKQSKKNHMTPKDKALELVEQYSLINYDIDDTASHKEGAMIAVEEVIKQAKNWGVLSVMGYWEQVKQELEKI